MIICNLRSKTLLAVAFAALPCACSSNGGGGTGDAGIQPGETTTLELATSGDDTTETETNVEIAGQSLVGSSSSGLMVQPVATLTNSGGGFYQPAGCVTGTVDTSTKTASFVFNGCAGPFGLLDLNGTVQVVWSSSGPDNLQLTFSASDFQINKATLSAWNATAVITANGDDRDMTWTASLVGMTGGGRAINRTNNKDIKWTIGQGCLAWNGSSDGTVAGPQLATTLTNYQRCTGACPAQGSEINIKDVDNGESVEIEYLGGASAEFTGVGGAETMLSLVCGQ
jgi:hypothetical protein